MVWVDNARIIAAFAVVLLHVANGHLEVVSAGTNEWWITNVLDSAVRWCVPVFVMISGVLLLNPEKAETAGEFFRKRAARLLVPLVFWSVFYLFWLNTIISLTGDKMPLEFFVRRLFSGTPYYHMWFVYMIVGLYLVTPFLRKITRFSSQKELVWLTVSLFILAAVNFASVKFFPGGQDLFINWFLFYIPYFLAGYLLGTMEIDRYPIATATVVIVSIAATAAGFYFLQTGGDMALAKYMYGYLSVSVIPMSLAVMALLKMLRFHGIGRGFAGQLAKLSFGVYLIHPVFIDLLSVYGISARLGNPLISIPLISIFVFALSLGVVNLIGTLPYLRRVV